MLRVVYREGLRRHAQHLHQDTQLLRLTHLTARTRLPCQTVPSHASAAVCQGGTNTYSTDTFRNNRHDRQWKARHRRALGVFAGALGTVAALGLGTVLSETQEERKCEEVKERDEDLLKEGEEQRDEVLRLKQHIKSQGVCRKEPESLSRHEVCVRKARKLLKRRMEEVGAPGMVVGVTVNGKQVWADGLGFADLENGVRCSPATVMRIASISKSLTMTAVAKLWEEGKIDLDAPVQKYVPKFPVKTYEGEEVTITTRHLISHKSGIRGYFLKDPNKKKKKEENKNETDDNKSKERKEGKQTTLRDETKENEKKTTVPSIDKDKTTEGEEGKEKQTGGIKRCPCGRSLSAKRSRKKKLKEDSEFDQREYYITEEFETVQESLELFQDDELFFKPGEDYMYTTHGWTLVSAVVEGAAKKPFTDVAKRLFFELGLNNTYLDQPSPIIYNRASYYVRDEEGRLKNAPYVDNSYKWAGGGFLSTVHDLCKFGNAMLYASQQKEGEEGGRTPGYLKASTIQELWRPVEGTKKGLRDTSYGMGWQTEEEKDPRNFCRSSRGHAYHTGGAIGASSVLLILPQKEGSVGGGPPEGVVVALLTNMLRVELRTVALEIAELFAECQ